MVYLVFLHSLKEMWVKILPLPRVLSLHIKPLESFSFFHCHCYLGFVQLVFVCVFCFMLTFEAVSHYVTLADLEFTMLDQGAFKLIEIFLPLSSKCWD